MSVRTLLVISLILSAALAVETSGQAGQSPAAAAPAASQAVPDGGTPRYIRPETPEQRRERLATTEDPGLDPDPNKVFRRYGKPYTIKRLERAHVIPHTTRPGFVRPVGVNFFDEVYQENDKYVWVWMEEVDVEAVRAERMTKLQPKLTDVQRSYLESFREEFKPLTPPRAPVTVRFKPASAGLPNQGNWRNSLAIADMNGDGFPDLVLPPQRAGHPLPSIYLGDGKGNWREWETNWPEQFDYGSSAVADFNKDGHMDVALGIHLNGVAILYGDGKGNFRLAHRSNDFPTRRIRVADVDADGWPDVVAITEGPMGRQNMPAEHGTLRAWMNRKKGAAWEAVNVAGPKEPISGDWLTVANLNGDKYPDFAGSTVYFHGSRTIFLSGRGPNQYSALETDNMFMPAYSYYAATTAGRFSSKKLDDLIVTSFRIWPDPSLTDDFPPPPLSRVVTIDRISMSGKEPRRVPIMRWKAGEQVTGLNRGDFNGDGHEDIVFTHTNPRELFILLGDGAGNFRRAAVEGVELSDLPNYDLEVADVNGDGRPDIIVMWASEVGTGLAALAGGVEVFLNEGAVAD